MLTSPTKDERFYGAGLGARTKQTARFHGDDGTIETMPTIMSLSGAELGEVVIRDPNVDCASVHQPWQCSPGLAGPVTLLGDNGVVNWLRQQNPVLAGAVVLGAALATGLAISLTTIKLLDVSGYKADKSLHGARRRRRR